MDGGDVFSNDFRWHAKHQRVYPGRWTASFIFDDGTEIEPFDTPEGWTVTNAFFTDSFFVAIVGKGDATELDFKIWGSDPNRPEQPAWLIHERQPNTVQGGFILLQFRGDRLTWLEPGPSRAQQSIPVYDLSTREMRFVIENAFVYGPMWNGDGIVWLQSIDGKDYLTGVTADGSEWNPPEELTEASSAGRFTVNEGVWAWVDKSSRYLYAWMPDWEYPLLIDVAAPEGDFVDGLNIINDFLFYYTHQITWVADLRSLTRAPITDGAGQAIVTGPDQVRMWYYAQDVIERYGSRERTWVASELPRLDECPTSPVP